MWVFVPCFVAHLSILTEMAIETNGALTPVAKTPVAAATKDEIKQGSTPEDGSNKPESQDSESPPKDENLQSPATTAGDVIKTPFTSPLESCKPESPAELTSDQQSKYEQLLTVVSEWTTIPTTTAKNAPTEPITDDDRMFMTRECLLRYLRATKWDLAAATNRLRGTLTWRREYGLAKLTPDYMSVENETGKQVILGYDVNARPCLYLNPARQNTAYSERQVQHLVFMVERVIDLMGPDQESLALLVNFSDTRSGQNATIGQGRQVLSILQNHYPERLGRALVVNIPFLIHGFFKLITPFIDPLTRTKLKFNEDLRKHVPPTQLLKSLNGEVEFEYDHSTYWPALNKLCEQRRKEYHERWVQGGKVIGEHESYLKGGSDKGLNGSRAPIATIEEKMERLEVNLPQTNNDQSVDTITPA
ncbi:CRAL/TRIO domain-containing protein [Blastomyces dermatitidis ATCC 18188]|uniref:CRAL/TRIO domain-containing protein n=1 Tax=Ajellomyces dermatitidis (strain ATCC 18188 / CBS 674.68) TaxID=653446 RepID=F2TCP7_AJEDA|nr:CRAL/TRIO domain-containing protein [Blastomyces dermatitidis ATCC 18188]